MTLLSNLNRSGGWCKSLKCFLLWMSHTGNEQFSTWHFQFPSMFQNERSVVSLTTFKEISVQEGKTFLFMIRVLLAITIRFNFLRSLFQGILFQFFSLVENSFDKDWRKRFSPFSSSFSLYVLLIKSKWFLDTWFWQFNLWYSFVLFRWRYQESIYLSWL